LNIREGRILKGVGGCYTVFSHGERYDCKARGRFRNQGVVPMVGDRVAFLPPEGGRDGYLLDILPRSNRLRRPAVSNVDQLVVVISADRPEPDLMLVDRLLVDARLVGVEPLLALNKTDLAENRFAGIAAQYATIPALGTSARSGDGMEELAARLAGRTACFAGQSGVGKTSLINRLCPGMAGGEIGDLSEDGGRGRHTTRRAELLPLPGGGWVVDTPVFAA
jgi:ribosome biogenesis GTPase